MAPVTVCAFGCLGAGSIVMTLFRADSASDVSLASVSSVAKSLAAEAPHWTRDIQVDIDNLEA